MSGDYAVSLTTAIRPAAKFLVDGVEYEMLGPEHLSPNSEARTLSLFARHQLFTTELELTKDRRRSETLAEQVRGLRVEIIAELTTLPRDIAETLPIRAQAVLMDAIREELEGEDDQEDEGAVPPGGEQPG